MEIRYKTEPNVRQVRDAYINIRNVIARKWWNLKTESSFDEGTCNAYAGGDGSRMTFTLERAGGGATIGRNVVVTTAVRRIPACLETQQFQIRVDALRRVLPLGADA